MRNLSAVEPEIGIAGRGETFPLGSTGRTVEIARVHAGLPERANHAMAAEPLERQIEREGGKEKDDQTDAQTSSRLRDSVAE